MDSEHRHELEENELQEFLTNFGEWWNKWGNTVMIVVVVVSLTAAVYLILHTRAIQARQSAWNDLATSTSPQTLAQVAGEHDELAVKILANLRGADLYLAGATAQSQDQGKKKKSPQQDRASQLNHAEAMYQAALKLGAAPLYKLNALMGLANVAEDRGQWSKAAGIYKQVEQLAKHSGYGNFASNARARLHRLSRLKQPVTFAPATQPATQPATEPSAKPSAPKPSAKPGKAAPEQAPATQP